MCKIVIYVLLKQAETCMYSFGYLGIGYWYIGYLGISRAGCRVLYIQPLKMELIEGSETSANHNRTPGKYPKEYTQYSKHGESLKSRRQKLSSKI